VARTWMHRFSKIDAEPVHAARDSIPFEALNLKGI
jgi:hypothetical protein